MTASEYVQIVLPLGGKANPLSLLINIFTLTARRSVAWPPSPERKITSKTQRYHLSGALGPPRRSKNKVKGPQEEDKQPTCRRTGTHVYTRHRRSHVCAHTHAGSPLETHTCTDSTGHTSPYMFITGTRVCVLSHQRACGTRRRPVCTYPREHLLVRAYASDTLARFRVHTQAVHTARWGA